MSGVYSPSSSSPSRLYGAVLPVAAPSPLSSVVQKAAERDLIQDELRREKLERAVLNDRATLAEAKLSESQDLNRRQHTIIMSTSAAAQQQPQLQQQQQFQQQLSPQAMSPQGALSPMSPQVVTAMAPAAAPLQQQQQQQQVPQMVASPTHQMPVHQAAAGRDEILDMVRSTTASSKREVESLAERVLTTAKEENTKIRNEMKTYLQETISTIRQDRDLEREREKCDRDRDREREKLEREKQAMQQQMEIHSLALQQQQQQQLSQQRTARAAFGGDGAGAAAAASVLGGGVAGGLSPVAAAATQQQHQQQSHLAHERDEAAKLATNAEVLAERRKGLLEVKEVEMQRLRQELHRVEADLHGALRRGAGLEADVARLEGAARTAKEEEERLRRQRAAADADAETHRKKAVEAGVECAALRERLAAEERAGRAAQEELRGLLREMTLKLEQRESRLTTAQEQLHAKTQESSTSSMRFEAEMKEYLSRPKRGEHEDALRRKSELQASLDAAALRLEEAEAEVATIRSLFRPYFPASTQLLLNQGPADPVALSARLKDLLAGRLLGADPSLLAASELHQALSGGLPVGVKPQDPLAALLLRQLVGGASAAAPLQQAAVAAAVQQQQQQQQSSLLVDLVKAMADKKETNLLEESAAAQKVILAKLVADASSGGGGSGGGGVGDDALLAVVSLLGGGGSGGGGGGVGGSNATQLSVLAVHVQQMRGELDQKRRRVDELEETATSLRQQLAKQERAGEEREAAAAKRARDQAAENEFLSGKNDRLRAELQQVGGEAADQAARLREAAAECETERERATDLQHQVDALSKEKVRLVEQLRAQEKLQEELLRQLKATMDASSNTRDLDASFTQRRAELARISDELRRVALLRASGTVAAPPPSSLPATPTGAHPSLLASGLHHHPGAGGVRLTPPAPLQRNVWGT